MVETDGVSLDGVLLRAGIGLMMVGLVGSEGFAAIGGLVKLPVGDIIVFGLGLTAGLLDCSDVGSSDVGRGLTVAASRIRGSSIAKN